MRQSLCRYGLNANVAPAFHCAALRRSILNLRFSQQLNDMDMRQLSDLLYRNHVRLKHADKNAMAEDIAAKRADSLIGPAPPVTADLACKMMFDHFLEVTPLLFVVNRRLGVALSIYLTFLEPR